MTTPVATDLDRAKRRTALSAAMMVVGMVCLGYASVPLYDMFCKVTGFGGTTQRADASAVPGAVAGKTISIRFDANHRPDLPWEFTPEKHRETITIGARDMAFFRAKNLSDEPVKGIASYNVSPSQAGKYFTKIECFCFTEQTLKPGEEVRMPVIFFVDPAILNDPDANDISEITLSYTFFPVDPEKG
ncbi:cytochrome c oxidase assembly protein [Sphingobium boeckii]|uniref:Cytochrome c oxidase assembly protein CtaG n=1 Tax=Sphingobium boeckii TaxID=1082345 RepID=A0A7W9AEX1_9SPHN|nr:cytochrome c oxidase assembly protein [Sphingobium boeckii]MBB5684189.1 cytochrome c oxidase assembly protein subunit 11 [Sphingobium boeckii]